VIRELTIVISHRSQLATLRALARDLRAEQPRLRLYCRCPPETVGEVADLIGPEGAAEPLLVSTGTKLRRRLYTFFYHLFAPADFSPSFSRRLESSTEGGRLRSRLLRLGRRITPQLAGPTLNRALQVLFAAFSWRRSFPTRRVAVLTRNLQPHILCTWRHQTIAVLDGWDHPTSSPAGFRADAVAAWNSDLAEDWHRMQGARTTLAGYAYKLQYALQVAEEAAEKSAPGRPRLLYAMATYPSRSVLAQRRHEEEIEVVRCLHEWLRPHVASFAVKPHPIGPAGHLDELVRHCTELVLHPYESSGSQTYDLTDEYNRGRLATLRSVDLVLGIWTTFLLDAAVAGRAIALIDLPNEEPYPALWTARLGLHVPHLRRRVDAVIHLRPEGLSFGGGLQFASWFERAAASGRHVATWAMPEATPQALLHDLLADRLESSRL
jgi:hypothetical protein